MAGEFCRARHEDGRYCVMAAEHSGGHHFGKHIATPATVSACGAPVKPGYTCDLPVGHIGPHWLTRAVAPETLAAICERGGFVPSPCVAMASGWRDCRDRNATTGRTDECPACATEMNDRIRDAMLPPLAPAITPCGCGATAAHELTSRCGPLNPPSPAAMLGDALKAIDAVYDHLKRHATIGYSSTMWGDLDRLRKAVSDAKAEAETREGEPCQHKDVRVFRNDSGRVVQKCMRCDAPVSTAYPRDTAPKVGQD